MTKFTEDPCVVFGTPSGPEPKRIVARGLLARVLTMGPSDAIDPVFVIERRVPNVRVRRYHSSIDGKVWVSPGYLTMPLLQYARLWVRAALRLWRGPVIPHARVVGK